MNKQNLLLMRTALKNDLIDAQEELDYLVQDTKFYCPPDVRKRRHELEDLIRELTSSIRSVDLSIAEIHWNGGVPA